MKFDELKEKFIKLKKEELAYIDDVAKKGMKEKLTEKEVLEAYRKINDFAKNINELLTKIFNCATKNKKELINEDGIIFDFDINKDYFSCVEGTQDYVDYALKLVLINPNKHKVEVTYRRYEDVALALQLALRGQYVFNRSVRILGCVYKDYDPFGSGYTEIAQYYYVKDSYPEEILKSEMEQYEKDKIIIRTPSYVRVDEVQDIYLEELNNSSNTSIIDIVNKTNERINELSYYRDPNTKEKLLLDKINELYKKVKGEFIKKEVLYQGNFLEILEETYKLPNNKIVEKEKVVKNNGKNAVIIIPVRVGRKYCNDKRFILTVQNRVNDKITVEFPSGYIEDGEEVFDAAKRELLEETGYTSDNFFILDEALTSPGIDNSTTYIVVANNCVKNGDIKNDGEELVTYELFNDEELKYVVDNNIMNGAMNKLAYYNFIANVNGSGYKVCDDSMTSDILCKRRKVNPFK